jgi:hypothetical protein
VNLENRVRAQKMWTNKRKITLEITAAKYLVFCQKRKTGPQLTLILFLMGIHWRGDNARTGFEVLTIRDEGTSICCRVLKVHHMTYLTDLKEEYNFAKQKFNEVLKSYDSCLSSSRIPLNSCFNLCIQFSEDNKNTSLL